MVLKDAPLIRNRRAGRRRLGLPPRRKRFSAGSAWRTCGIRPGISGTILFNMSYAGPFLCFSAGVLRIPYFKDKEQPDRQRVIISQAEKFFLYQTACRFRGGMERIVIWSHIAQVAGIFPWGMAESCVSSRYSSQPGYAARRT